MVIEKKWENGVEVKKTQNGLIIRIRDGCVISWMEQVFDIVCLYGWIQRTLNGHLEFQNMDIFL